MPCLFMDHYPFRLKVTFDKRRYNFTIKQRTARLSCFLLSLSEKTVWDRNVKFPLSLIHESEKIKSLKEKVEKIPKKSTVPTEKYGVNALSIPMNHFGPLPSTASRKTARLLTFDKNRVLWTVVFFYPRVPALCPAFSVSGNDMPTLHTVSSDKRNMKIAKTFFLTGLVVLVTVITGCDFMNKLNKKGTNNLPKAEAVTVGVMSPVSRVVTDYEEFTGQTTAVDEVDIRAQVLGILKECKFEEGTEVAKDAVLFEIEPEVYLAILGSAQGEADALKARIPQLKNELDRQQKLYQDQVVSESEFECAKAEYDECQAKLKKAEANVMEAKINLKYTSIRSPIDGYISRKLVTEGNLVQAHSSSNSTLLAKMVSLDPIYVIFYVDETTYLKLDALAQAKYKADGNKGNGSVTQKIEFRLSNEEFYTDKDNKPFNTGEIHYSDPFMDQNSGTILLRATCKNLKRANGTRKLLPGMVVRVRIPIRENYEALIIPEEAIGTDQGKRYVYVVNTDGTTNIRHLELGPLQQDNMRVVRKGLKKDEVLVVSGLLRLRPGVKVAPKVLTIEELREGI